MRAHMATLNDKYSKEVGGPVLHFVPMYGNLQTLVQASLTNPIALRYPYKIFDKGGVKVAVLGEAFAYTPVANPRWMMPKWSFGIREDDVRANVAKARKEGAQLVVLLSHNGFDTDRKMASRVEGIDVILTAHTHDALPEVVKVGKTLLERGLEVHAINPKQMDRFRDRFTMAGAKDDSRDAEVMASSLRTDPRCFRSLAVADPIVIELREWSRMADDLGTDFGV